MSENHICVLTLNCWGLKYVAKDRVERIEAIAVELSKSDYDIVGLQELWVLADFELIRSAVLRRLPYAKFFYSGALGAGLAIFSRYPIVAVSVHPYSLNGSPLDVKAGDWFVGKAAVSVVIRHKLLGEVEFFNTHLFAKGGEDGPEHNRAHRLVNAWEFAKIVRTSAHLGRYVISIGDFNSIPTTLPMAVIREHSGLIDTWVESHSREDVSHLPRDSSPEAAIALFGVTADSPLNSYSAGKPLDPHARKHQGKRLDYIFYRHPHGLSLSQPRLSCKQSGVVFTRKVPGANFSFSDHFGLEATFEVVHPSADAEVPPFTSVSDLSKDSAASVLRALGACYRVSLARSRQELLIFGATVVALFGLIVGSAALSHSWIFPIFMLVAIAGAWLATTMLYSGFIFGNWERGALTNVIEELELLQSLRTQDGQ